MSDEQGGSPRSPLPSVKDVARLAGVAQSTVSRAFTPGARISAAARAKVLSVANEIGYRPNLLARSLISGRSGIVGVVMGDPRNPFYVAAFDALSNRLADAGLHMLIFTTRPRRETDVPVQDLLKYRVDVVLLMSANLSSRLADRCAAERIPVIFFNRRARGEEMLASSVTGANAEGASEIADHLLGEGYRRFAFMAGVEDSSTSQDRERAFTARLLSKGLTPPLRVAGHFERECARDAMRTLLRSPQPPEAVFCANDDMALAAMEVARFEFGLSPGRDIGLAGFDDIEQASWPSFELTSYSQPVAEMADVVMSILSQGRRQDTVVPGRLVVRSSTRRRS